VRDLRLPSRQNLPLFAAVKAGDRAGIAAALAAGAEIDAKNDDGESVLAIALGHDHTLHGELVDLGADLYAEDNSPSDSTVAHLLDEEQLAELEPRFRARGGRPPESPFRVIHRKRENRQASLDRQADDGSFPMKGMKRENVMCDYQEARDRERIVSDRMRALLIEHGASPEEFQAVGIRDHAGQPLAERFFVVTPQALDCLDHERAEPTYYPNYTFNEVKRMALIEARVPEATGMFAVKDMSNGLIFLRKQVAEALEQAGMTGLTFKLPKR
jgi:hypothetical protein